MNFDYLEFNFCQFLEGLYGNRANFKPSVWDTGSEFCQTCFIFVITRWKLTFLSAAIFDFLELDFCQFLDGLYGNRANFKPSVWDTVWKFCQNSFRFVIRRSKLIFLSAVIFDFVKFNFCQFLEGLYGNRANFKPSVWATGWKCFKNSFRFVIRREKLIFLSAAIFDFLEFNFCQFLEGLYGNRTNFKGSASATGWRFSKDFFTFVIRRFKLIVQSSPIFDFVKFHFWRFLEDLYGNPTNFKGCASATGWELSKDFYRFVISRWQLTFLTAAIFEFLKS